MSIRSKNYPDARQSRWLLIHVLALTAGLAACKVSAAAPKPKGPPAAATPAPSFKITAAHPRILLSNAATKDRLTRVLNGPSPAAARFRDQVDGQLNGRRAYAFQPWYAALMFQLTGDKRYAAYAIEETDKFVATEEARIDRGQRPSVAGDSYLEVGQLVGNVALIYDWCHDLLTSEQRQRWTAYGNKSVANVWNHRQASWGGASHPWTGWSVDNPSNNYYYSFLRATMLLGLATHGENSEAKRWIDQFRTAKIENQLLPTFNRELQGGGSREGTGYGTAMKNLWQLYDWWERSTGEPIAVRTPHTLASMAHLMHSIVPTLDRLAPTGDHARDSTAALFDYHREYLLVLTALFPDERLSGVAATLLDSSTVPQMKNGFMSYVDFLYEQPDLKSRPLDSLATSYWAPGTGQLMTRSAWDPAATFSNFICGPYSESHAHRDQGSFVIFKGSWLATDSNVFSHSGIEQSEDLHNLVRIENGGAPVKQVYGTSCALSALASNAQFTYASANTTPSYRNNPAVRKIEREFLFIKPDTFVVFDRADTATGARGIWTLNLAAKPVVEGSVLRSAQGKNRLDVFRLSPNDADTTVHEWPPLRTGMKGGVRVDVSGGADGGSVRFLHVLSADGAVVSATRSDAPGMLGASIKLADGRTALARFSITGVGGTLELRTADQRIEIQGPLPSNLAALPMFID